MTASNDLPLNMQNIQVLSQRCLDKSSVTKPGKSCCTPSAEEKNLTPASHVDKPKLPARVCQRIVDKVVTSRLTIIVGPTGCGKSTQIPAVLLDGIGGPVLCTQPRRLAVVSVASHVAGQRGVRLGGDEVGYHVGQNKHATQRTKLLFATAGVLLEEMRSKGVEALSKYKCVLIDECHERSSESDLCLALIKSFMISKPNACIRVVLMSATFHHGRYRSFFDGVPGCEDVDTVTLESVESINAFYSRVKTSYLEDIIKALPPGQVNDGFARVMRLDPDKDLEGADGGTTLSYSMLHLIYSLVSWLDRDEPSDAAFLIFAPTYRHLEQCYDHIESCWRTSQGGQGKNLALNVLHSSIDIDDCLQSIRSFSPETKGKKSRRLFLASAIADSSLTIPGVTCVIDMCRALEVRWDLERSKYVPKTVWASKSICDQRQGRTGRTCTGRVFRLVNKAFYVSQLESWDQPQLALSSCRNETLSMLSSKNRLMSDPVSILRKCMDPPSADVMIAAVEHLTAIGACEESRSGKLVPTEYGKMLSALPFDVCDSRLILEAAQRGMLHEALALRAILSVRPYPITHHFAESNRNERALQMYHHEATTHDSTSVTIANLAAFMFWDATWNTTTNAMNVAKYGTSGGRSGYCIGEKNLYDYCIGDDEETSLQHWNSWSDRTEEVHAAWCKKHEINPSSVRTIADTLEVALRVIYNSEYEPDWIRCSHPEPIWRRRSEWKAEGVYDEKAILCCIYDEEVHRICSDISSLCKNTDLAMKSMDKSAPNSTTEKIHMEIPPPIACMHHLRGSCTFGDRCRNSHAPDAVPPPCRFFRAGNCSKGKKCLFSHNVCNEVVTSSTIATNIEQRLDVSPLDAIVPPLPSLTLEDGARGWFKREAAHLLLLGEKNFEFTKALLKMNAPPRAASTNENETAVEGALTGVDAPRIHKNSRIKMLARRGKIRSCAWMFPSMDTEQQSNETLLLGTFISLSLLFEQNTSQQQEPVSFGLALQGDELCRWSVLRSARRAGWTLSSWNEFDCTQFPGYRPFRSSGGVKTFYVFHLI